MTTFQKVIKYLALALAIFIIINIVSAIWFGIFSFSNLLGLRKSDEQAVLGEEKIITSIENSDVKTLKISLKYSNLIIKKGNKLTVETNNDNISSSKENDSLVIKEKDFNWFWNNSNSNSNLILQIPEGTEFNKVKIEAGAGEINIEEIFTNDLSFEMGAGKVEIKKINVTNKAKIDGGAGKVDILSGEINDLDLDMGIGKFAITTKLTGNNKIDAGVGKLDINLTDVADNYTIKADNGIGAINFNGRTVISEAIYGSGDSLIDIDGGIGSIDINTK